MDNRYRLILASASPRRRELLTRIGAPFEVVVSECDEDTEITEPSQMVMELSRRKAEAVEKKCGSGSRVILAADTVVVRDGIILGKPSDDSEAYSMLRSLSGRTHEVFTGVTMIDAREEGKRDFFSFAERTEVEVFPLSDEEIRSYIATGECRDKAGAYAIQGLFTVNVKGISGDYNNVVGLPVARVFHECKKRGIDLVP